MKFAALIAILTFGTLPGLQATPIDLTATTISFGCEGQGPCGFYEISGPGFEGEMLGGVGATTQPGGFVELDLDGNPFLSTLTIGNTTYEANSISASGPAVIADMTSTTFDADEGIWSASGPAAATGQISICLVSALSNGDLNCDPGLAFAIINLPGLSGTFSVSWADLGGNPLATVFEDRGGSLSATIIPEPLTAGIAFAGLLLLVVYRKCQSKRRRALRDRVAGVSRRDVGSLCVGLPGCHLRV